MVTTINGAFQAVPVERISFTRRFHRIRRQVIHTASEALTAAKRGATVHMIPAIAKGADVTLRVVDGTCTKANKATVAFLVKYPGIAKGARIINLHNHPFSILMQRFLQLPRGQA